MVVISLASFIPICGRHLGWGILEPAVPSWVGLVTGCGVWRESRDGIGTVHWMVGCARAGGEDSPIVLLTEGW